MNITNLNVINVYLIERGRTNPVLSIGFEQFRFFGVEWPRLFDGVRFWKTKMNLFNISLYKLKRRVLENS